ncbi:MAG: hypothetical protein ACXVB5_18455, partial [Isosphaeraceae bacterium]
PTRRVPLTLLWQAHSQADRHRTLRTLSRIVAQQLPRHPADKEADRRVLCVLEKIANDSHLVRVEWTGEA